MELEDNILETDIPSMLPESDSKETEFSTIDPSYIINLIRRLLLPHCEKVAVQLKDVNSDEDRQLQENGESEGQDKMATANYNFKVEEANNADSVEIDAYASRDDDGNMIEEAGCVLWDLATSQYHANFMVENHILEVLLAILNQSDNARTREICIGILGNLACHEIPEKAIVSKEGLLSTIVQQLFVTDTSNLTETCRLLNAGLHSPESERWATAIESEQAVERVLWIASNTLNDQLLEKSTELLLAMVDNTKAASAILLPSLLSLGLINALIDLIMCELTMLKDESSSRGDVELDFILQIFEALSLSEGYNIQLADDQRLFKLVCEIIQQFGRDEIVNAGISAMVLLANLLTEKVSLVHAIAHDPALIDRLLALVPFTADDLGSQNALWSIFGRILQCLVSDDNSALKDIVLVFANGYSLLLDDLEDLQDPNECSGYDSRQAKLVTLNNMMQVMRKWLLSKHASSFPEISSSVCHALRALERSNI